MTLPIDRDAVLAAFREEPSRPLKAKDVGRYLEIEADRRRELRAILNVLVDDGDLVSLPNRRFALPHGGDVVTGRVSLTQKGYGWLVTEDDQSDAFLPPDEVNGLLAGDTVRARVSMAPKGPIAKITKVLARGRTTVTGTLVRTRSGAWVECPSDVLTSPIRIEPDDELLPTLKEEVVVEVLFTRFPTPATRATGRLVRVIGRAGELRSEIEKTLADSAAPREFSPEAIAEAEALPSVPSADDARDREDLRSLPLCTIDGETAKDFDDAVYARKDGNDLVVIVAIADVSHYVSLGSALDEDARLRGTSIYFPGNVVPMLPEALSNGLCSLNPEVDRLCMAVEMRISKDGQTRKARFLNGVMNSHARLTYTTVARYLEGERKVRGEIPGRVQQSLDVLTEASRALRRRRTERGAMDFDLPEEVVQIADDGHPVDVQPLGRNEAHRLIEDLMIAANEAVAERFFRRELPSIYRVHPEPDEEKVKRFLELARMLALDLGQKTNVRGGGVPSARTIRSILQPLSGSPSRRALDYLLLRAMMQARYSAENVGHYSLASEAYTHFTSPIRRYPDLVVHRLLKQHIKSPRYSPDDVEAERQTTALDDTAADCSEKERRATDLERSIRALHTAWLMKDKIGEKFSGAVSGCASFGAFVRVEDPFVEGMVRAQSIGDGLFTYDELRMRLTNRAGFSVGVGDEVEVKLEAVDIERRQITFQLLRITSQHGEPTDLVPPRRGRDDDDGGRGGRGGGRGGRGGRGRGEKEGRGGRSGDGGRKKERKGRRGRNR